MAANDLSKLREHVATIRRLAGTTCERDIDGPLMRSLPAMEAEIAELRSDLAEALALLRTYRYTAEHAIEDEDEDRQACDALLAKHREKP